MLTPPQQREAAALLAYAEALIRDDPHQKADPRSTLHRIRALLRELVPNQTQPNSRR